MRIIFMGTPEFAIPSLEALRAKNDIIAVVTAPDKPAGRGHVMHLSEIKQYAVSQGFTVLQPINLKSPKFYKKLKELKADLFVVVAFRMLPESIWSMPKYGTINLHSSLLPKYRGAAPIQRAIMNGDEITGLTVFKLDKQIDTGAILATIEIKIGLDETGGQLHDRMKLMGAKLLAETIENIENGTIVPKIQLEEFVSNAPKIFREDCQIDWNQDIHNVYNLIRALIPYPCAWFINKNITYKIHAATMISEIHNYPAGKFIVQSNQLRVTCLNGYINITEIQAEGKRKMPINTFLNGYKNFE
ncbi:MAG: methionyl-tRNA formyltransferase [Saprospiraceae bacterium]|nr:methionyl-tRNA formyltransferase [Saprospiraceae bacterium]